MSRTLVLGGARSGKSTHAEVLANQAALVDYVATSATNPDDPEWVERIALHRARRPEHWTTIETADVAQVLRTPGEGTVLVDCLGVWATRMMDHSGIWEDRPGAREQLQGHIDELVAALEQTEREVVLVSNEVGQGVVPEHWSGRFFRDQLGILNSRVAACCERVVFCVAGIPVTIKDEPR